MTIRVHRVLPVLRPGTDVTAPARRGGAGRGRPTLWRAVPGVAAAIVVVVGVTVGVAASHRSPVRPAPVASAALRPIEAPPSATGSVAVYATGSTRSLTVDARNLPAPSSQSYYEVWLLDPATQEMLPMGVLPPSGRGQYAVSSTIMAGYSAVDVSLQANDGDPAHSQTSVMRAHLQA